MTKKEQLRRVKYAYTKYRGKLEGRQSRSPELVEAAKQTMAERVIYKFGGARDLWRMINEVAPGTIDASAIYRWTYPREKGGTGGIIPTRNLALILKAARLQGILLDEGDFHPEKK